MHILRPISDASGNFHQIQRLDVLTSKLWQLRARIQVVIDISCR